MPTFAGWWEFADKAHCVLVVAGQQRHPLIQTALAPLTPDESKTLIRAEVERIATEPTLSPNQRLLRGESAMQTRVVELGQGIPLLLRLLTSLVGASDLSSLQTPDPSHGSDDYAETVIKAYLNHLNAQREQMDEVSLRRYYLLRCAALPQRIPHGNLMRSIWQAWSADRGIPAPPDDQTLWQQLQREAGVTLTADGALVFHELMRRGLLASWADDDPVLVRQLHHVAAQWFAARNDRVAQLDHEFHADPDGTFARWQQMIEAALTHHDGKQVQALLDSVANHDLSDLQRAWLLLYKADLAWAEGNTALAIERLNAAQSDDPILQTHVVQGLERWLELDPDDAETIMRSAKRVPHWTIHYMTIRCSPAIQAKLYLERGDYDQALTLYTELGDRQGQANVHYQRGNLALQQGEYGRAAQELDNALTLYTELGDRQGQANVHLERGRLALIQGEYGRAAQEQDSALALYTELGDRRGQANVHRERGRLALLQAAYRKAKQHLQQVLQFNETLQLHGYVCSFLTRDGHEAINAAQHHRDKGETQQARQARDLAGWLAEQARWLFNQVEPKQRSHATNQALLSLEHGLRSYDGL